jgi:starvation-inducible DNA-binding protein
MKPGLTATLHPLPESVRVTVVPLLEGAVVACVDLERQAKQLHWTVRGPKFMPVHELLDSVADAAEAFTDLAAERLVAIGGIPDGTCAAVAAKTPLPTCPVGLASSEGHLGHLQHAVATLAQMVYRAIKESAEAGDPTTSDLFTEISRKLDQLLWKLEAHQPAS